MSEGSYTLNVIGTWQVIKQFSEYYKM